MEKTKITGYKIYNEDMKERTRVNTLAELYPELPNKKYDIIYADPPWDYGGKLQFDKTSTSQDKLDHSRNIFISSASFFYPTLKFNELAKLRVQEICAENSLLFMWSTNPHLEQAIKLGTAWGFEYKTVAFVWNKMVHNPGQYTLSYCELCLVFKHGKIPRPRGARNIKQLVNSPRGEHSEKPEQIAENIELMFPTQKKIELFSRRRRPGWDCWGLDVIYDQREGVLI